jgi:hypothetical protein
MRKLHRQNCDHKQGLALPHILASLGFRVFPVAPNSKRPLIDDFYERATRNHAKIDRWLARWPNARWAIITGVESGGVALDIDRKCNADGKVIAWGLESLHRAGIIYPSAATPTARTPRGGFRQLFRHPGTFVKSGTLVIDGQEIAGIEVKGDGPSGHCIVAGRGYEWQPYYPLTLALAPCPPWMIMANDRHHAAPSAPVAPVGKLSRYCETALRNARKAILEAPAGQRHDTLLRIVFNIAGLVDGYGMPAALALDELERAAIAQPRNKPRPSHKDILKTVRDAFDAGLRHPREVRHGR